MPTLNNPSHEAFAQAISKGETADSAYAQAGYRPNRGNATRMNANESISRRVAELVGDAEDRTGVTIERTLEELSRVAYSDLRTAFTQEGALLHPDNLDKNTAAAISSVEMVTRPTGERDSDGQPIIEHVHKIKLWDKNSALEKLCKHLDLFVGRLLVRSAVQNVLPKPTDPEGDMVFGKLAQCTKNIPLPNSQKRRQ